MNPPASKTPINLDQSCLFVGTVGAGKTQRTKLQIVHRIRELSAAKISPFIYKIIIIDTKPMNYGGDDSVGHFSDIPDSVIIRDWRRYNQNDPHRVIIFRPPQEDIHPSLFEAFFKYLISLQFTTSKGKKSQLPFLLVLDELTDIITQDGKRVAYIQALDKLLRQGRQSLQTVWINTQYPVYIDSSIKRLSTVRFIFRLLDQKDRDLMASYTGYAKVKEKIKVPYGFWYQNEMIFSTLQRPVFWTGQP